MSVKPIQKGTPEMWSFAISTSGWSQSVSVRKISSWQVAKQAGKKRSKLQSINLPGQDCTVLISVLSSKAKKRIKVAGPQTPSEFDVHRAVRPASV